MLTSDTKLAVFGMESLNATFAAVSQNTELTGPLKQALRGLGDFAVAAGGDIGKNLTSLGSFIGLLQKSGSLTDEVVAAAGQVGGKFAESIDNAKKMGITSADALMKMFSSGEFAKLAGLEGALDAVNNTLMGQLKSYFTQVQTQFADFGQFFLPQTKTALDGLASIFRVTFMRISGTIMSVFGDGKLMSDILNVFARLGDFTANVLDKYLLSSSGMMDGIKTAITVTLELFYKMRDSLNSFSEAGKIVTDALGPVVKTISQGFGDSFRDLRTYLVENRDEFIDFGDALAGAFDTLRSVIEMIKDAWQGALPTITAVLRIFERLKVVFDAIGGLFSLGGQQPTGEPQSPMQSIGNTVGGLVSNYAGVAAIGGMAVLANRRAQAKGVPGGMFARLGGRIEGGVGGIGGLREQMRLRRLPAPPPIYGPPAAPSGRFAGLKSFGSRLAGAGKFPGALPISIAGQLALLGLSPEGGGAATAQTLGAGLSFINPMLGLGVSGVGTALAADNAIKGGLSGAMGGAAIGSMIAPGVGTAIGAGIGATTGVAMGAVRQNEIGIGNNDSELKDILAQTVLLLPAAWNDASMRDVTADRARGIVADTATEIAGLALTEGSESAFKRLEDMNRFTEELTRREQEFSGKTQEERKAMADELVRQGKITRELGDALSERYMGTFADETREANNELNIAANTLVPELNRKLDTLSSVTGKSEQELSAMAATMGVNLFDGTMSTREALEKLGLSAVRTAEQIGAATREIYAAATETFIGNRLRSIEGTNVLDQAAEDFRGLGGTGTEQQLLEIQQSVAEGMLLFKEGDAFKAAQEILTQFDPATEGRAFRMEGGPYQGANPEDFLRLVEVARQTISGQSLLESQNFAGAMLQGPGIGMSQENLNRLSEAMVKGTPEQVQTLRNTMGLIAAGGGIMQDGQMLQGEALASAIEGSLNAALAPITGATVDLQDTLAADADASERMRQAIEQGGQEMVDRFGGKIDEIMDGKPDWWMQDPLWYEFAPSGIVEGVRNGIRDGVSGIRISTDGTIGVPTDPSAPQTPDTPTSRLARTMGRHNFYDNQFAGKRTVTSSWRNTNLGSINSDHVTGNAYDLIGQNLGAYATMVNQTGGFAEFHGVGGARHLHVVPGQTPVGDTVAPIPAAAIAVGGSGSTAYNITINAAQGQDPNAIAAAVMSRIDERDRNMRERR